MCVCVYVVKMDSSTSKYNWVVAPLLDVFTMHAYFTPDSGFYVYLLVPSCMLLRGQSMKILDSVIAPYFLLVLLDFLAGLRSKMKRNQFCFLAGHQAAVLCSFNSPSLQRSYLLEDVHVVYPEKNVYWAEYFVTSC